MYSNERERQHLPSKSCEQRSRGAFRVASAERKMCCGLTVQLREKQARSAIAPEPRSLQDDRAIAEKQLRCCSGSKQVWVLEGCAVKQFCGAMLMQLCGLGVRMGYPARTKANNSLDLHAEDDLSAGKKVRYRYSFLR